MKKNHLLPVILMPSLFAAGYALFPAYKRFTGKFILPCPIRIFTGFLCPGCGGTHALSALRQGDILSAFSHNALVPVWLIIFFAVWLQHLFALFGKEIRIIPTSKRVRLSAVGIMIVYIIMRNL